MATFNKTLAHQKYPSIPMLTLNNLELYIEKGINPGGGLKAVLEGDLFQAFNKLDKENSEALKDLVMLLWNDVPKICLGDKEAVREWMAHSGYAGWAPAAA
jgi:hypothetical protein